MLGDVIVIIIIGVILALAIIYIVKAKKSGQKCIGCPHSKTCASKQKSCCTNNKTENLEN